METRTYSVASVSRGRQAGCHAARSYRAGGRNLFVRSRPYAARVHTIGRCAALVTALLAFALGVAACGTPAKTPRATPRACPASVQPTPAPNAGTSVESASAWPAFLHDARHTGQSPATGPQSGAVRWTRKLERGVSTAPVLAADGTIYVASRDGVLHALDPATGDDRWVFDGDGAYGSDLSTSALVLPDGTIMWPGPHSQLYALDPAGMLLWTHPFDSDVLSPALTPGGSVVIVEMSGRLHVLDFDRSGARERWSSDLGASGASFGSPAVGDDGTIYATAGNRIVALRDQGDSGEILRHFEIASGTEVSPAVSSDGIAVFGTNDEYEYGVDADGLLWRFPRNSLSFSSPAVTEAGLAYFGDHNGFMNVVDVESGCLVTRYQGGGEIWTSPAIDARGDVYFGTKRGHILGFAFDGRKLFDIDTGRTVDSYPAIAADGTLLIGSENGLLYAVGG